MVTFWFVAKKDRHIYSCVHTITCVICSTCNIRRQQSANEVLFLLFLLHNPARSASHGRPSAGRYRGCPQLRLLLDHARARGDAWRSRVCLHRPPREASEAPRAVSLRARQEAVPHISKLARSAQPNASAQSLLQPPQGAQPRTGKGRAREQAGRRDRRRRLRRPVQLIRAVHLPLIAVGRV